MKLDKAWFRKVLQDFATFGQMGFHVVVPPILLCVLANFAVKKLGIGQWIVFVAIIIGLLCSFLNIYKLCRFFLLKSTRDNDKNVIISYRKHS